MKTAIVAVLMLTMAASPWVKAEPVEVPATVPTETIAVSTETVADGGTGCTPVEAVTESNQPADDECWEYSATCTITHYCHCAKCNGQKWAYGPTASGVMPTAGRTVAVDKSVIPLGAEVLIGDTVYIAEDTGVKGYHIDIFCDSHSEALERGMYKTTIFWR